MERVKAIRGAADRTDEIKEWLLQQDPSVFVRSKSILEDDDKVFFVVDSKLEYAYCNSITTKLLEIVELPQWRAKPNEIYYYISENFDFAYAYDKRSDDDNRRWEARNYFRSAQDASEFIDDMNQLLKPENYKNGNYYKQLC